MTNPTAKIFHSGQHGPPAIMGLPLAQYGHTCYCVLHSQCSVPHNTCGHWFVVKGSYLRYIPVALLHETLHECLGTKSFVYWAFKRYGGDLVRYKIVLLLNRNEVGMKLNDLSCLHRLANIGSTNPHISPLFSCKDVERKEDWVLSSSMEGAPLSTLWKCN